jgi:hypothetical protein
MGSVLFNSFEFILAFFADCTVRLFRACAAPGVGRGRGLPSSTPCAADSAVFLEETMTWERAAGILVVARFS